MWVMCVWLHTPLFMCAYWRQRWTLGVLLNPSSPSFLRHCISLNLDLTGLHELVSKSQGPSSLFLNSCHFYMCSGVQTRVLMVAMYRLSYRSSPHMMTNFVWFFKTGFLCAALAVLEFTL